VNPDDVTVNITMDEILAEMDVLARAKFDAALAAARATKLQIQLGAALSRIDELEQQKGGPADGDHS
jgi:BMFP domain-containing protein YqiC